MNKAYLAMMKSLNQFKEDKNEFRKVKQEGENEIARFHKFVKNEIIEIADSVEQIKEQQRKQEQKIDAIYNLLKFKKEDPQELDDKLESPETD